MICVHNLIGNLFSGEPLRPLPGPVGPSRLHVRDPSAALGEGSQVRRRPGGGRVQGSQRRAEVSTQLIII